MISIVDAATARHVRTLRPDVTAIYSPDWSPDGKRIVFCAVDKGQSDLFLYDLTSGACTQLTDDIMSEADPRFTRDGKSVVFSCQDTLGNASRSARNGAATMSQLWRIDVTTRQQTRLTFSASNKKSPCFSPDGSQIMYVSDANGIDNLYVAPIDKPDSARALSDVLGGISNPDWTAVAGRDSATLVYCLFQKGGWDIWQMKDPLKKLRDKPLEKTKWAESLADMSAQYFSPSTDTLADTAGGARAGLSKGKNHSRRIDGSGEDELDEGITERVAERDTASRKPAAANKDTAASKPAGAARGIDTSVSAAAAAKPPDRPVTLNFDTIPSHPYRLKFEPDIVALGVGNGRITGTACRDSGWPCSPICSATTRSRSRATSKAT